ncbi:uncharacterized protein LOC142586364 [Dermacentor variabilis]|uniref:uncharacterized protein LOC142586364 n=1 Tax=Dermacentor variabilis TaxID=34621 RepID=UPI003F5BA680
MHSIICQLRIAVWCNFRSSVCSSAISGKTPPHRQSYGHGCNIFMGLPLPWVFEETCVLFSRHRLFAQHRSLVTFSVAFFAPVRHRLLRFHVPLLPYGRLVHSVPGSVTVLPDLPRRLRWTGTMRRSFAAASCSSDGAVKSGASSRRLPVPEMAAPPTFGLAHRIFISQGSCRRCFLCAARVLCCQGPLLPGSFAARVLCCHSVLFRRHPSPPSQWTSASSAEWTRETVIEIKEVFERVQPPV